MSTSNITTSNGPIKAVLFDFMGTCLDWHSNITSILPNGLSPAARSAFAIEWRQAYFDANSARVREGKPPEDIDVTHRRVLNELLAKHAEMLPLFSDEIKEQAVRAWHTQRAWPDVADALQKLKEQGLEIFVHANGTTRLQLDLVRASNLRFDMLFSSELLGCYKPAPENYRKVLELLQLRADECVMVAAHAYDLRGAKAVGLKTVYVYRWTDDVLENQALVRSENDAYLEDMSGLHEAIARL